MVLRLHLISTFDALFDVIKWINAFFELATTYAELNIYVYLFQFELSVTEIPT